MLHLVISLLAVNAVRRRPAEWARGSEDRPTGVSPNDSDGVKSGRGDAVTDGGGGGGDPNYSPAPASPSAPPAPASPSAAPAPSPATTGSEPTSEELELPEFDIDAWLQEFIAWQAREMASFQRMMDKITQSWPKKWGRRLNQEMDGKEFNFAEESQVADDPAPLFPWGRRRQQLLGGLNEEKGRSRPDELDFAETDGGGGYSAAQAPEPVSSQTAEPASGPSTDLAAIRMEHYASQSRELLFIRNWLAINGYLGKKGDFRRVEELVAPQQ